jgi:hypothetical protein
VCISLIGMRFTYSVQFGSRRHRQIFAHAISKRVKPLAANQYLRWTIPITAGDKEDAPQAATAAGQHFRSRSIGRAGRYAQRVRRILQSLVQGPRSRDFSNALPRLGLDSDVLDACGSCRTCCYRAPSRSPEYRIARRLRIPVRSLHVGAMLKYAFWHCRIRKPMPAYEGRFYKSRSCRSLGDLKKYSTATKACLRDQAQPRGPHSRSVARTEVTIVDSQERSVRP